MMENERTQRRNPAPADLTITKHDKNNNEEGRAVFMAEDHDRVYHIEQDDESGDENAAET